MFLLPIGFNDGYNTSGGGSGITNPLDIPDCDVWLRADLGITTGGIGVTNWANQGPGGTGPTQIVTSGYEPRYHISGGLNDQAYLKFDAPAGMNWGYTTTAHGESTTILVFKISTLAHSGMTPVFIFDSSDGATTELLLDLATYQEVSFINEQSSSTMVGFSPTLDTNGHILLWTFDGIVHLPADYTASYDGVTQTVVASGAYGTPSIASTIGLRPNGTFQYDGEMYELIIYTRVLDGIEQSKLLDYLQARYGL